MHLLNCSDLLTIDLFSLQTFYFVTIGKGRVTNSINVDYALFNCLSNNNVTMSQHEQYPGNNPGTETKVNGVQLFFILL